MSLANWLNLTNSEFLVVLAGGGFLTSLATFVTLLLVRWRGARGAAKRAHSSNPDPQEQWLKESESLCLNFSKHLEEKREIGRRLMEQLDEKIRKIEGLLAQMDKRHDSLVRGLDEGDRQAQVLEMAEAGFDASEIARRSCLPKGEVQLILDLKRYHQQQ